MAEHTPQTENTAEESASEHDEAQIDHNETQTERKSSLPVVFSALAMLIAALALAANLLGNKPAHIDPMQSINSKLGQIEARIGDVEAQMSSDKLDVVDTQLKQILLSLKQLAHIADDTTRQRIDRAYKMLEPLTMPATRIKAEVDLQEASAPENQSAAALQAAMENNGEDMPENAAETQDMPSASASEQQPAIELMPLDESLPAAAAPTTIDATETEQP